MSVKSDAERYVELSELVEGKLARLERASVAERARLLSELRRHRDEIAEQLDVIKVALARAGAN
jgi:hypothetical protein